MQNFLFSMTEKYLTTQIAEINDTYTNDLIIDLLSIGVSGTVSGMSD